MLLEEVSARTDFWHGQLSQLAEPYEATARTTGDRMGAITRIAGATLHSIRGLDVCASRRRATAAMRRRFHGATGGATIRGAICGTYALTASKRARPTGADRFAGTNACKPRARDGASFVRAWPTSLTTKCRHHGASICGHSFARRPRSIGSCSRRGRRTSATCCRQIGARAGRTSGLGPRRRTKRKQIAAPAPCRDPGGGQVPQRRAHVGAGGSRSVAGAALSRHEGTNFLDHRWGRIRRRCTLDASGLAPRPPRPGAHRRRQALRETDRQQSRALAKCHRQRRRPGPMAGRFAGARLPAMKFFPRILRRLLRSVRARDQNDRISSPSPRRAIPRSHVRHSSAVQRKPVVEVQIGLGRHHPSRALQQPEAVPICTDGGPARRQSR